MDAFPIDKTEMSESVRRYHIEEGSFRLDALLQRLGEDYLLSLRGGAAHIGAVAMAQPRPGLKDPSRRSATASVFCYVGHKEDEVVKRVSERMASALDARVVVVAGMHWDRLTPADIERVMENAIELVDRIIVEEKGVRREHG